MVDDDDDDNFADFTEKNHLTHPVYPLSQCPLLI